MFAPIQTFKTHHMSHPLHHAISSSRKYGGRMEDYLPIHNWFDAPKVSFYDMRHRALRHHTEGIHRSVQLFGETIKNSDGLEVSVQEIGEQHCFEDLGYIPSMSDYLSQVDDEKWDKFIGRYNLGKLSWSPSKRWGGKEEDYQPIIDWFEEPKKSYNKSSYRLIRQHSEGIFECEAELGTYIINSDGKMVPTRLIGEYFCLSEIGAVLNVKEMLSYINRQAWIYASKEARKVVQMVNQNELDKVS